MAESVVGFVVDKLLALATEEANLLRGVHKEIADIERQLESLRAFLKDADLRAEAEAEADGSSSDGVKLWVQELREVAFEIEDVVDEYILRMGNQGQQGRLQCLLAPCRGLLDYVGLWRLKPRHKIASHVQDIKASLRDIRERGVSYGFDYSATSSSFLRLQLGRSHDPARTTALFLEKDQVVGVFQKENNELLERLKLESTKRVVISVVGMGGSGKTTLAKQIYDLAVTKTITGLEFDCHIWIRASEFGTAEKLLRALMKELQQQETGVPIPDDTFGAMGDDKLIGKLRDYLRAKRYLVVFDDVWKIDFWRDVEYALLDNNKGARVIITTRNMEVANSCSKSSSTAFSVRMSPLPQREGLKLFRKIAFVCQVHSPPELRKLSSEIVRKCDGLPLAIVTVAAYLSTKLVNVANTTVVQQWQKFCNSFSWELEHNHHLVSIKNSLLLSYYDLPYYLKSCFLYLGMLPENTAIKCGRLMRLWIAEGFIRPDKDKMPEVIAQEYLAALIERSVVLVLEETTTRKPKTCCLHNILREVILVKMEDLSFCQVLSDNTLAKSNFSRLGVATCPARRLSFAYSSSDTILKGINESSTRVRSVFVCKEDEMPNSIASAFVKSFKLLKILEFMYTPCLDSLPEDIGSFFHLRYLSVKGTNVKLLPKSIGKLRNLETLDLRNSSVYELPVEINRLRKLQHLLGYQKKNSVVVRGLKVEKGIGCLESLQKLSYVEASVGEINLFEELKTLTRLKKLGIVKLRSEDGKSLCTCVELMKNLESLSVVSTSNEDEIIDLDSMSTPPRFLQRLFLCGHLMRFPAWMTKLQNLVQLKIASSKLEEHENPLKAIQTLPSLLDFEMYDAYDGEQLRFERGAFPKLNGLSLRGLSRLKSLIIEEGALQVAQHLHIFQCPQLKEVPSGIRHLRNLQCLHFKEISDDFMASLNSAEGRQQYYAIVEHVLPIYFTWKSEEGATEIFQFSKSGFQKFGQVPAGSEEAPIFTSAYVPSSITRFV